MVTIIQTVNFLTGKPLKEAKNLGSFFSRERAENHLGWFFVNECCAVVKF